MSDDEARITGGCLCGALRYEARGEPTAAGFCYCGDCRKASGSGFVGFLGFAAAALRVTGPSRPFESPARRGGVATRNSCALCSSLVFGGVLGESTTLNIYAGSLDEPARFVPTIAIFVRERPSWAPLPPGLRTFDALPVG